MKTSKINLSMIAFVAIVLAGCATGNVTGSRVSKDAKLPINNLLVSQYITDYDERFHDSISDLFSNMVRTGLTQRNVRNIVIAYDPLDLDTQAVNKKAMSENIDYILTFKFVHYTASTYNVVSDGDLQAGIWDRKEGKQIWTGRFHWISGGIFSTREERAASIANVLIKGLEESRVIPVGPIEVKAEAIQGSQMSKDAVSDSKQELVIRLEKLRDVRDRGLITNDEYDQKKKQILDGM